MNGSSRKIKDLPIYDRPKEKALRYGIKTLSNVELLAILINTGTRENSAITIAEKLLTKYQQLTNLVKMTETGDFDIVGIKHNKALTLLAAFQLFDRVEKENSKAMEVVNSSAMLARKYMAEFSNARQEMFLLVALDKAMKIIKEIILYVGTKKGLEVDVSFVIDKLIRLNATYYVMIHNHPSGNIYPSLEDFIMTRSISESSAKHDVHLYDHLIISNYNFFSFREQTLILDN